MTKRGIIRIIESIGYQKNRVGDWSHPKYKGSGSIYFSRFKKINYIHLGYNRKTFLIEEITQDDLFYYITKCNPELKSQVRNYKLGEIFK